MGRIIETTLNAKISFMECKGTLYLRLIRNPTLKSSALKFSVYCLNRNSAKKGTTSIADENLSGISNLTTDHLIFTSDSKNRLRRRIDKERKNS